MKSDLTSNVTCALRLLVLLTGFAAETRLHGADAAIWHSASPNHDCVSARFWSKPHELWCKFRDSAEPPELRAMVDNQPAASLAAT